MRMTTFMLGIGLAFGVSGWAEAGGESISFELPRAGRASLAVYDGEGRMVRTLLTGKPLAAGTHSASWDGLDRYGDPLPAGSYTWKLVSTQGLRAEYLMQVGQNVDPAWERATGNHEAPVGAAIDRTGLYRVGAGNEGARYAVKTDLDGKHLWVNDRWSADPWAQPTVAVALLKGRLFELMPNGDLYGYDAATGKVFTGGDFSPKPWNLGWEGYTPPAGVGEEQRRKLRAKACPADIAADASADRILAAYPQHDAVTWFSAADGKRLETVKGLRRLAGVACGKDGTGFAIVDGSVVSFTREKAEPRVVIPADRLQNPWRLAVDPQSGDILVAENSLKFPGAPPHHQVKRFDPTGKLLRAHGKPEGRTDGVYVAADFRGITDIEADPAGGFIVTEGNHTPPRRTARFDAAGGLVREWFGAQHYGVIACPEPSDPRFVWTRANAPKPGLIRWEVDYARKTWRVAEVYQDAFSANRYATVPEVPMVFEHRGRVYIQGGSLFGGLSLVVYDPKAKRVRPCVGSEWLDAKKSKAFLWCDLNDDGRSSDDEVSWVPRGKLGGWIDPADLSLRTSPSSTETESGHRHDPAGLSPGGTPLYSARPTATLPAVKEAGGVYRPFDFRLDRAGNTYGSFADLAKNPNEGAESHGAWYYNSCSAVDRLVKWDASGRQVWSVGRHSPDADHETGSTAMPRGLVGLTHGCVIWGDASDEETARPTVWTEDGLYVDELLRVPLDFSPKEAYGTFNAHEYPNGRLHTDPATGEVLYFAVNSGGGAPIYRINGWDGWHRREGKLTLKEPAKGLALRDGTGLTGEYFNTPDCSGQPALTRKDALVYFNWGKGTPDGSITAERFSVRWSGQYEAATNEDLRFEVRGSFPWRDRGRPLFTRLWLNGRPVIDSTEESSTARVRLTAGQRVDVRLECGFRKGEAAVALSHDTPGLDRRAVLPAYLHPRPAGTTAEPELVTEARPAVLARFDFEDDGPLAWSAEGGDVFGRMTGAAVGVPGRAGRGIELAAKGEFAPALFAVDEELRLPDADYSVSFWFKTTSSGVRLCEARRYSSYNNRWADHVVAVEGGRLAFRLLEADPLLSEGRVDDGEWHHAVTGVGDGGHSLYLDGKLAAVGKRTRRARTSNRLGLDLGPGAGEGTVAFDGLRIEGRAPTPESVSTLYAPDSR